MAKVPGAVFADCLFLIGQAWVKRGTDIDGAVEAPAAAMRLVPPEAAEVILFMIEAGELPELGPGAEAMDAWLEQCRQAGSGEFRLTPGYAPAPARPGGQAG
ncbi:MAG: hypothetical protein ACRDRJ_53130, partial [Streptosporangiaceae bacterium]